MGDASSVQVGSGVGVLVRGGKGVTVAVRVAVPVSVGVGVSVGCSEAATTWQEASSTYIPVTPPSPSL